MSSTRKPLIIGVVAVIIVLVVFSVVTVAISLLQNPGTETGAISAEKANR